MGSGDKVYTMREVELIEDGIVVTRSVPVPNVGDLKGVSGMRSYVCCMCGRPFKADRVRHFRGKVYGIPCGCSRDIEGILLREREDKRRGSYKGQELYINESSR